MKKFRFELKHWLRRVRKKALRHNRAITKKFKPSSKIKKDGVYVIAPRILSMGQKYHGYLVRFKEELERYSALAHNLQHHLRINFRETEILSADACTVLLATIDTIKCKYPDIKFSVIRPKNRPMNSLLRNKMRYDVDAVFCHLGLYKLLGFNYTSSTSQKNVKCWHFISGDMADGKITSPILNELQSMGVNTKGVYSSYIEAIANAVEHAYTDKVPTSRQFPVRRWWMLLAVVDDTMSIFVCDLGHGIPNTLEYTQDQNFLSSLWTKILMRATKPTDDCLYIKVAASIKESRTELEYRGKGSTDIKSLIKDKKDSILFIHSNKGTYTFSNDGSEKCYENIGSINGTLIQWNIPLN